MNHRRFVIFLVCVAACAGITAPRSVADDAPPAKPEKRVWTPLTTLDSKLITEASGVVASRKHHGVLWAHPDSGNEPKLVALDADGNRLCEVIVEGAPNIDWEDIATDDSGHLYIGDIGNNTGLLPVRYIYQVDEPDPANPPQRPIAPTKHWRVRYGKVDRLNLESLFIYKDAFYVVARTLARRCAVYKLAPKGDDELELQLAVTLGFASASGADVSPDGSTLLLCSPHDARLFALHDGDDFKAEDTEEYITYPLKGAIEACCFYESDIVFIAENGNFFRTPKSDFDEHVQFRWR